MTSPLRESYECHLLGLIQKSGVRRTRPTRAYTIYFWHRKHGDPQSTELDSQRLDRGEGTRSHCARCDRRRRNMCVCIGPNASHIPDPHYRDGDNRSIAGSAAHHDKSQGTRPSERPRLPLPGCSPKRHLFIYNSIFFSLPKDEEAIRVPQLNVVTYFFSRCQSGDWAEPSMPV